MTAIFCFVFSGILFYTAEKKGQVGVAVIALLWLLAGAYNYQ